MSEVKLLKMTFVIYVKMMLLLDTNQNWHSCQLLYDNVMILTMLKHSNIFKLAPYTYTVKSACLVKKVIGTRTFQFLQAYIFNEKMLRKSFMYKCMTEFLISSFIYIKPNVISHCSK